MSSDPFSSSLVLVGAECVVSGGFTADGQWGLKFRPKAPLKIVAVVRGSCWVSVAGFDQPPLEVHEGEVAIVNGWHPVRLASDPSSDYDELTDVFLNSENTVVSLSEGDSVAVLGGHIELNQAGQELLLSTLPTISRVGAGGHRAQTMLWVLRQLLEEMAGTAPGTDLARQQYAQILMLEVFRSVASAYDELPPGWLRVISDPQLSPAVQAMHERPGHKWSLEELARLVRMSRSSFAERFKALAGVPPLSYLLRWRLLLAERSLLTSDVSVAKLGAELGYASESAFSNAFKKFRGVSPRTFRKSAEGGSDPREFRELVHEEESLPPTVPA